MVGRYGITVQQVGSNEFYDNFEVRGWMNQDLFEHNELKRLGRTEDEVLDEFAPFEFNCV